MLTFAEKSSEDPKSFVLMIFNSLEFLIFLPVVFLLYWKCVHKREHRNLLLLVASYFFYGWWSPKFLLLIFITTTASFISGIYIGKLKEEGRRKGAKWVSAGNILLNLGILGLFKYFDFFSRSFADAMALIGWQVDSVTLNLILPIGISFYTFQALSYTIDVYKGTVRPTKDVLSFFVFLSFFPQLVAGPIERATNLLPQFLHPSKFDYAEAVSGMRLILWGLFKKMIVADNAAPIVDSIFTNFETQSTLSLWIGTFLFSMQIYCDFSGYSDIAVGVGRLFGVRLMRNFNFPYLSKSLSEFWKRWHISLSKWFRDYVYIPLGGNRKGKARTYLNTMIVFMLSGLWHGADYTFVVWGLYHGGLALLSRPRKRKPGEEQKPARRPIIISTLLIGSTFILILIGRIFFRADTLPHALGYIARMFTPHGGFSIPGKTAICWSLLMLIIEYFTRHYETPFSIPYGKLWRHPAVRWSVYLITFFVILIFNEKCEQFIYFQF